MLVDRFLIPESLPLITPQDFKSQTIERLRQGFLLAKSILKSARKEQKIQYDKRAKLFHHNVGDKVLLDARIVKSGTSKKLNPRYQGPFCVRKVFPNDTVEIMSSDGVKTILTHVNRIKPLFETMVWKDEECVQFDDIRPGD